MEAATIALLVGAAFLAGFIDSQVGGGGAISLPALLAAGVPAHAALGTNKLVATGASSVAAASYLRAGLVRGGDARRLVPLALAGSAAGALLVLHVPAADLGLLVVLVVAAMTVYVLARPRFGQRERPERRTALRSLAVMLLVVAIGFYDGFLGPGTGSFLLFALASVWGMLFLQAAALGRVLNLATNLAALLVFVWQGEVRYAIAMPMLLGTMSGGLLGARVAIRGGSGWVRWLFVAVALVLMARLLVQIV